MLGRFGQKKTRAGTLSQRGVLEQGEMRPGKARVQRLAIALAFIALVAALTREPKRSVIVVDELAEVRLGPTIYASKEFGSINLLETQKAREAAVAQVPEYYRVDSKRVTQQWAAVQGRIERMFAHQPAVRDAVLEALRNSDSLQPAADVVAKAVDRYVATLKEDPAWADELDAPALAQWLTPDIASLPERRFAPPPEGEEADLELPRPVESLLEEDAAALTFTYGDKLQKLALDSLKYILTQGVWVGPPPPADGKAHVLRRSSVPLAGQEVSGDVPLVDVPGWEEAVAAQGDWLQERARHVAEETETPAEWAKLHEVALATISPYVEKTIVHDQDYTAAARDQARDAVEPVMKLIKEDHPIQRQDEPWTAQSRSDWKTYAEILKQEERPVRRVVSAAIAHAILVGLVLLCLRRATGLLEWTRPEDSAKHLNLALLLMCAALIVGRVASYFEPSGFMLPVAACGILLAILANVRFAALVSILTAALVSAQYGYDWRLLIAVGAMSLAGVFSIVKVRRRSDMAAASLMAMAAGLLAMLAITLATDTLFSELAMRRFTLVALNGGICLLAVPGLLSPLERLFGITTDIQLLEYSDLNSEVLGRVAIEAPGTYAHSLMLGQYAEAAADAIGANGLLARVCAYYHDLGKMRRSKYFSENQTGQNIHDGLSPRLSARAIAAHVVQGAEMAREYHLPKPIVDGILEHHGTCLIGCFYQQAVEQRKHGDVREEDFRYPGPKPQSPETAILMICDAAESGVRSIKNPTEERVREFIDKIIANRASDRQFDDCNLTLRQLNIIAEVVAQRIVTNLHTRVPYPEVHQEEVDNVIALSGGAE